MSSLTPAAGTDGCTSSTCGDTPTSDTGARSAVVSKPSLANKLGFTTSVLLITRRVSRAGGAFATSAVPMFPRPPGMVLAVELLAQTLLGASTRATTSTGPPGANGATIFTGRL